MQSAQTQEGSTKRYRFKDVIPGKKSFRELTGPIEWLKSAGLLIKVKVCNRAEIPLESFSKENVFKLYLFDIGLLGAMLELPYEAILRQDYGIAKGFFAENFVVQEFLASGSKKLYSWARRNSEVELIRLIAGEIIPIEVKSGLRTRAKSLDQYIKHYHPQSAIKISAKPLSRPNDSLIDNYPLYLAGRIGSIKRFS